MFIVCIATLMAKENVACPIFDTPSANWFSGHAQNGLIKSHIIEHYLKQKVKLLNNVSISNKSDEKTNLTIAEAL